MSFTPQPYQPSSDAHFTPTQGTYKELKPFRYWCQKVLPLVYDDSLSYYELLCKVVDYLNKTMEDVDTLHVDVDNLHDAYSELETDMNHKYTDISNWVNISYNDLVDYVNTYFENLDVQEEINNKLDAMAESGELSALIVPLLPEPVDAWLAEHITNPSNPPLDTSLTLTNAAAPAKTVGDKLTDLNNINSEFNLITTYGYDNAGILNPNGTYSPYPDLSYRVTDYIPVKDSIYVLGDFGSITSEYFHIIGYTKNKVYNEQVIRFTSNSVSQRIELDTNTEYIRVMTVLPYTNNQIYCFEGYVNKLYNMIDNTLLVSGKGADAKVTGDKITAINTILNEFNLITTYPYSYSGVLRANGIFDEDVSSSFRVTDYIPISDNIYLKGNFGQVSSPYYNIVGYDIDKNFNEDVVRFTSNPVSQTITLDEDTKYIRVMSSVGYTSNEIYSYTGMIGYILEETNKIKEIEKIIDGILNSEFEYTTFTECEDSSGMSFVGAGYGLGVTNMLTEDTIIYSIEIQNNAYISTNNYFVFINSIGKVLAKFPITSTELIIDYVVPESGFIAFICQSNSASSSVKYKYNVSNPNNTSIFNYIVSNISSVSVGDTLNIPNYNTTIKNNVNCKIIGYVPKNNILPYANKTISFLGDSITAGLTWDGSEQVIVDKPYPKTVEEIFKCITQNKGYSSYPISSTGKDDCLLAVYNTITEYANYIVVFAGTNDLHYNVPIGTKDDRTDISFYGAVYSLINGIVTNYPNAQLVFMTPLHRSWEGPNTANANLSDYVNAMIEMCGLCGIPVIDLYHNSYFNYIITTSQALFSDGLHPTQDGYNLLGKVIAKYLNNILMLKD